MSRHTTDSRGLFRPGKRSAILLSIAALAALAIPAGAQGSGDQKVTVMTRNLFLGADLGPALGAPTIAQAIDGAGVVWNEFQSTKFPERAAPLAREIQEAKPDLIGLQEVALWRKQSPSDGGAPPISPIPGAQPASTVEQDFLDLLQQELDKGDVEYEVVAVQEEFEGELPADVDGNNSTGTGPLGAGVFGADLDVRLTMRDVILAREGTDVALGDVDMGHFANRFVASVGGVPVPVDRGWISVEGQVKGDSDSQGTQASASEFLFVNTHLEAFGSPTIREAQAKELLAGPLDTEERIVLVGDLNSGVARHNLPIRPGDQLAFEALEAAGFADNGAVHSCCYPNLFDASLEFTHTVDHVLTRPGLRSLGAFVTGDDVSERTPSGLWPSDHGGVVSQLHLRAR